MSAHKTHASLKRRIAPALIGAVCMAAAKSATAQTTVAVPLALTGWNNNVFFGTGFNNINNFPGVGATGGSSALPNRTFDNASASPFLYGAYSIASVPAADGFFLGAYYKSAATSLAPGDTSAYFAFNGQSSGATSLTGLVNYDANIVADGSFNASQDEALQLNSSTSSATLTVTNPTRVKNLYLYMAAGNGPGTVTITFNYASSHSYTFTQSVADWVYSNGTAANDALPDADGFDLAVVSGSQSAGYSGESRQFYQYDFAAPDTVDKLDSITFKSSLSSPTQVNLLAVSASSPTPAPPSAFPFGLGSALCGFKLLRRRRRKWETLSV